MDEYPKAVQVDGITLIARDAEHEKALLAGKPDPQVLRAEQARKDAEAAEAQRVADEAAQKAKDAAAAAKAKPAKVEADPLAVEEEARRTQGRDQAPVEAAKASKAAGKKK